jgi:tRNA(Leu) C34 or U34 (ribose-2'-O)-methylase TrmL
MSGGARGFASIGLFNPKNDLNVGGALRAASCYGASLIVIQGARHKKSRTDTMDTWKHTPLVHSENLIDSIPFGAIPVAIEFIQSARSLTTYTHPESAFYIFGPEDGSVSKSVLASCRDVVYVPTEYCMNLAATVNVVLYDRLMKRGRP